jgi:hypothetical protein
MEQCRAQMGLELHLDATGSQQLGMPAPPAQLQLGIHAPPALQLDNQTPLVVGGLESSMMDAMLQQSAAPAYVQWRLVSSIRSRR